MTPARRPARRRAPARLRRLTLLAVAISLTAAPVPSQTATQAEQPGPRITSSHRAQQLALNGVVGGVSAAAIAIVRGRNPLRAIPPGVAGGLLVGAGKQLAGARFSGAGLVGRQVSAAGISVVRSTGEDTTVLVLPGGPVSFEVRPRAIDKVRPRVNLLASGTVLYYALRPGVRFDLGASLSAGAPAFRSSSETMTMWDGEEVLGRMDLGTILLAAQPVVPTLAHRMTLQHESIHVLQLDYLDHVIALPLERAIVRRLPFGDRLVRHTDLGLLGPVVGTLLSTRVSYASRPWEKEALRMTEGK